MARQKNRKKSPKRERVAPVQPVSESTPEKDSLRDHSEICKAAGTKGNVPCGGGRQVGLATCLAGMFLCLVLGVYIGTLVPDVNNAMHESQKMASGPTAGPIPADPVPIAESPPTSTQAAATAKPVEEHADAAIPPRMATRISALEKDISLNPSNTNAWIELGNLFFDTGQISRSIHAYEHALALEPNNADVLTDLGIMYRESGHYERALESFRKASTIKPGHVNALFNEGVVLAIDLDRKADAAAAWEKLLKINPDAIAPDGRPVREMIRELR